MAQIRANQATAAKPPRSTAAAPDIADNIRSLVSNIGDTLGTKWGVKPDGQFRAGDPVKCDNSVNGKTQQGPHKDNNSCSR